MSKSISHLLLALSAFLLLYVGVSIIGNIVLIANAADRMLQGSGQSIFWILMVIFSITAATPFFLYFKFPKALIPPLTTTGHKFEEFLTQLRQRLSTNTRLKDMPLNSIEDIEMAMGVLSKESDKIIRETATSIFISTSIMQNGRLDGLITLCTQARMVWRIASIYQQRPSPRKMIYLYSNVGTNVLLAESIDEIDISEIVSPLFASSLTSSIPGMSLIVNSVANGTANAFLTLRVGSIAKQYCEAITTPNKGYVRRSATLSAMSIVGDIVKENGSRIMTGSWSMVTSAVDSTIQGAKSVMTKVEDSSVNGIKAVGSSINTTLKSVKDMASKITSK